MVSWYVADVFSKCLWNIPSHPYFIIIIIIIIIIVIINICYIYLKNLLFLCLHWFA